MNGLEISIVPLSQALENVDFRIDPEFHQKPPFKDKGLYKFVSIGEILKSAQYGLSIDMNEEGIGYSIYRMNEMSNMLCSSDVAKYADISEDEMRQFELEDRDVLFNRTNSQVFVGRTGLFKKFSSKSHVFASYLIRLKPDKKKVLPEYLTIFLNTKLGVWDVKRRARISINQSNVNAEEVKAVRIPLLSIDFQLKLKELLENAFKKLEQSKRLYAEAEETLLEELGLKNLDLSDSLFNVCKFSDVQQSDRMDAEHYNKKYDCLESKLKAYPAGCETIGNLCLQPINGAEVREYVEQGTPYLRVGDLRQLDISEDTVVYIADKAADAVREKVSLQEGDVLISRSGSLGISCMVTKKWENAITSSHLIRLRLKDKSLDPYYLALFMNTTAGVEQVRKMSNGGIQPEINQPSLKSIIVPLLSKKAQAKIRSLIIRSHETRDESKRLLELSKRAVEVAIEKGEAKGRKVLE